MSGTIIPSLNVSVSGAIPTPPATLRNDLVSNIAATVPDYTADLPGSLIEDLVSTGTGLLAFIDQARVDAINGVAVSTQNPYILNLMGGILGIPQGQASNTSVYIVFSGSVGYILPAGFIVSDGIHQYALIDGGVITSTGQSNPLFAVATSSGSWSVNSGTVTTVVTSVPSGYTLTVTNPTAGTSGGPAQTVASYRTQVIVKIGGVAQGVPTYIKSLLIGVLGVNPRLVNILQVAGGWEVIVGGGDPYAIAEAIYSAVLNLSTIIGSNTSSRNINVTLTNPPDTYTVIFVNPPLQVVTGAVSWNTNLPNFTGSAMINQVASLALVNYVNSISVGQPINLLEATNVFQTAIENVLDPTFLSTLVFTISVNGVVVSPSAGTSLILSDQESYFQAAPGSIVVVQG